MTMKRIALLVPFLLASPAPGMAGTVPSATATADDRVLATLQRQLFPTVTAVMAAPAARALLAERAERDARCKGDTGCRIEAARWSDADIARLATQGDGAAIRRELAGLNKVIAVYAQGVAPAYPLIDGPGVTGPALTALVATALASGDALRAEAGSAHDPGLALALTLLDSADRLEAVHFGPLAAQENARRLPSCPDGCLVALQIQRDHRARYRSRGPDHPAQRGGQAQRPYGRRPLSRRFRALHHPERIGRPSTRHALLRGDRDAARADRTLRRARGGVGGRSLCPAHDHQHTQRGPPARGHERTIETGAGRDQCRTGQLYRRARLRRAQPARAWLPPAEIKTQRSPNEVEILPRRTGLFIDPADPLDP